MRPDRPGDLSSRVYNLEVESQIMAKKGRHHSLLQNVFFLLTFTGINKQVEVWEIFIIDSLYFHYVTDGLFIIT